MIFTTNFPAQEADVIGRTLGRYRIVEQIGIGGMATVYKAYDPDTDRHVALKVLPQHFSHDPTFKERFNREAKAIARLEHLHILPIFAYGEDAGTAYMAMRYLKTGTLTDRIKQGPLPLAEAARILDQVAGALDHAHAHGVLHRDIKPSNILLDEAGNAYLTDFGIAKIVESTMDLTRGDILGTPAYMSPEQCQGQKDLTPASDIYSLGIVLYEMVTGRTPFQAETPIALIHMHLSEALPLPRSLRPELPESAQNVILKALAKDPGMRHKSCTQMAAAFNRAVIDIAVAGAPADDATPPEPADDATLLHGPATATQIAPKKSSRKLIVAAVGGLALIALAAVLVLAGLLAQPAEDAAPQAAQPAEDAAANPDTNFPDIASLPDVADLPQPRWAAPCDQNGLEPGLCIESDSGEVIHLLTESELMITTLPAWSPDGRHLAFAARDTGAQEDANNIYIVSFDEKEITPIITDENDIFPAWSPDGEWLVMHSSGNLVKVHPDGTGRRQLLAETGCSFTPQWSTDAEQIVVSVLPNGCEWKIPLDREIWLLTANGEDRQLLLTTRHENPDCVNLDVAFSPDRQQVAYMDGDCQAHIVPTVGIVPPRAIDDFPWHWLNSTFPQWAGE
ncbi:MAG: hypothetical protein D6768_10710 [Chloroflexi bacterium]|nr:MAG: hypothetical protein D6768_10710 [Chloroflexota bacterium]